MKNGPIEGPDPDDVRQLLRDEYFKIQDLIESFDDRALTIKTWSVSFSFAAIAAAYAAHAWPVLLLAGSSSFLFWSVEGFWKTFQHAHYHRLREIEDYFAGERVAPKPLQIGRSWYRHWKQGGARKFWRVMLWPHVWLPHAVACGLSIVLTILHLLQLVMISD